MMKFNRRDLLRSLFGAVVAPIVVPGIVTLEEFPCATLLPLEPPKNPTVWMIGALVEHYGEEGCWFQNRMYGHQIVRVAPDPSGTVREFLGFKTTRTGSTIIQLGRREDELEYEFLTLGKISV